MAISDFIRLRKLGYTRKVYDDILISPVVEGDDLKVYAVSDRLENTSGRLQLQVCRFDGTVVYHWDKSVGISGNDSRVCFSAPLAKLLEGADRGTVYVRAGCTITTTVWISRRI